MFLISIMLSAAMSFFLNIDELKRNVPTVAPHVKHYFCLDGRYLWFDHESPLSTDGSRELIRSHDNTILVDVPDLKEIEKRQKYLDMTKEYGVDLLLVLDSDEYVECDDWSKFEEYCRFEYENYNKQTNQFSVYVENANTHGREQFDPRPRIFANPYDIKHVTHRHFVTKTDGRVVEPSTIIVGLRIRHDYTLRHDMFTQLKLEYQKKLEVYEKS